MKKAVIIYTGVINLICLVIFGLNLCSGSFKFNTLFFLLFSAINLAGVYFVLKSRYIKAFYFYFSFTNLLQAFTFLLFGVSWKFILGPGLSIYIIDQIDLLAKLDFKIFNIHLYANKSDISNSLIGINLIHLFLFVGFLFLAKRSVKL